jgi:hypothetical protein
MISAVATSDQTLSFCMYTHLMVNLVDLVQSALADEESSLDRPVLVQQWLSLSHAEAPIELDWPLGFLDWDLWNLAWTNFCFWTRDRRATLLEVPAAFTTQHVRADLVC